MWFVVASAAHAGSLTAWGMALGQDSVAVMPFASADGAGTFGQVYAAAGLGDRADVNVGVGSGFSWDGGSESSLELLPRAFVSDSFGLGAHLAWTPGSGGVIVSPEVYGAWSTGRFTLGANAGWAPVLGLGGIAGGELWAVFAPEVFATDRLSFFCELDPLVSVTAGGAALTLVPGASASFDEDGAHSAAVGVGLTPGPAPAWSAGLSWTSVFSTARRPVPVVAEGSVEPVED